MPQLDYTYFYSQFFWLFITFVMIYFFISKFISPNFLDIFNERNNKISNGLKNAELVKHEILVMGQRGDSLLSHARKSSSIMISDKMHEIKKQEDKIIGELEDELSRKLANANNNIEQFILNNKQKIFDTAIESSFYALNNIFGVNVSMDEIKYLIVDK